MIIPPTCLVAWCWTTPLLTSLLSNTFHSCTTYVPTPQKTKKKEEQRKNEKWRKGNKALTCWCHYTDTQHVRMVRGSRYDGVENGGNERCDERWGEWDDVYLIITSHKPRAGEASRNSLGRHQSLHSRRLWHSQRPLVRFICPSPSSHLPLSVGQLLVLSSFLLLLLLWLFSFF